MNDISLVIMCTFVFTHLSLFLCVLLTRVKICNQMSRNVNITVILRLCSAIVVYLMCLVSTCSKTKGCFPDTATTRENKGSIQLIGSYKFK
jgi:hypothetical protein